MAAENKKENSNRLFFYKLYFTIEMVIVVMYTFSL